jgi:nickel/cobalt exporter
MTRALPARAFAAGGAAMRRSLLAALVASFVAAVLPAAAHAHPLGNFSVNHLAEISVSRDRVDVRYLLDKAEIPTFEDRGRSRSEILARTRAEVARRLQLTVDGARVPLAPGAGVLTRRPGQGGLETTRVVLRLHAAVRPRRAVTLHDGTFPGRVGWKAIRPVPGRGTAVRSSVTADDPTRGLASYPAALLSSPSDVRDATLRIGPGSGTVSAPSGDRSAAAGDRSGDGFAALLERGAAGDGVLVLLLLAAFGWGAVHALSPGHGKAMVAAYLVGTRGRPRDAVALGLTVTVTHTVGVFAVGLLTLALSAYVLPEDLYPWLNLVSGLMVVGVGAAVLAARVRDARGGGHGPAHDHGDGHAHAHGRRHARAHGHAHPHRDRVGRRGLLAMGASAGLIPCPSALVVLLGAIAQHEVALGLLLIVAFSGGLAATLTAIGVLVVKAARLPAPRRVAAIVPALSALVIVGVGVVLTVQAVPQLAG